jgi:hypothetical protein
LNALSLHRKTPKAISNAAVISTDTAIEPRHPTLLEKNKNT